jgi:iron(III) transport system substrate-binding protein
VANAGIKRVAGHLLGPLLLGATVAAVVLVVRVLNPDPRSTGNLSLPSRWMQVKPAYDAAALALRLDVVWAGGIQGLHAIDRRSGKMLDSPGMPGFRLVRDLLVDRSGVLWVAHDRGVARLADRSWLTYSTADGLPKGEALAVRETRAGEILIGAEGGICRWNGSGFEILARSEELGVGGVDGFLEDRDGFVWANSAHPSRGGLLRLWQGKWENMAVAGRLPHTCVTSIHQDPDGTLRIGTGYGRTGGLAIFSGGRWRQMTKADGLAGERVRSIFLDSKGRHWFGSEFDGIAVTDGANWRVLTPKDGLSGWEVQEMIEDPDGQLWLGTENGVTRIPLQAVSLTGVRAAFPGSVSVVAYVSVDQAYSEPILKEFTRQTGIEVKAVYDVEASKTTGLVHRLLAETERPRADVYWNGEFVQTMLLAHRGVLATYLPSTAREIPLEYRDPKFTWTGMGARVRVLLARRDTPEPHGLDSLTEAAYPAGRIGIAFPLFGSSATHAAGLYSAWGRDKARGFYRRLRERGVRVVDGNSVVRDLVVSGELQVGLTDSDDACGALARGADVRIVLPDQDGEGTMLIPGTVAMVKGGPNTHAARRLVDFLAGAEAERMLIESGFAQMSVRPDGPRASCLAGRNIRTLAVGASRVWENLAQSRTDMMEIFLR